jgi:signal peptide peptidase SppA
VSEFWALDPRYIGILDSRLTPGAISLTTAPRASQRERAGKVGFVSLLGVLSKGHNPFEGSSTLQARRELRQAVGDPSVKAIVLLIDSPGGTVAGTQDLASDVREAAKIKPTIAHIDDLGASAAFWIASQASAIYANAPTALVGSIGTIMTLYDMSEAAAKAGIKPIVVSTGPMKSAGIPGTKVTAPQVSYLQKLANEMQSEFDAAVRSGRKKMKSADLAKARTGEVFTARRAIELNLIDGIQSLEKTIAELS